MTISHRGSLDRLASATAQRAVPKVQIQRLCTHKSRSSLSRDVSEHQSSMLMMMEVVVEVSDLEVFVVFHEKVLKPPPESPLTRLRLVGVRILQVKHMLPDTLRVTNRVCAELQGHAFCWVLVFHECVFSLPPRQNIQ